MKSYAERLNDATGIYNQGLENVNHDPEPKGQKFAVGSRVHIADDLGSTMRHFKSGCDATVEYTYAHAYGGSDVKSYSLIIDNHGSSAWYNEWQLTAIEANSK